MSPTSCLLASVILMCSTALHAGECAPTPHRTTGTHYKPVTEQRGDVSKGLRVSGRILAAPECTPVPNARVAHWQAGEDGHYADHLRAYLYADVGGVYAFETEWPALEPPHIHFIVSAEGYQVLETQWVGDQRTDRIEFDMVLRKSAD